MAWKLKSLIILLEIYEPALTFKEKKIVEM